MLRESATEISVRKNSRGASPLKVGAERHLVSLAWRDIGLLDFVDAPSGFGVDPLPWTLSAWRRRVHPWHENILGPSPWSSGFAYEALTKADQRDHRLVVTLRERYQLPQRLGDFGNAQADLMSAITAYLRANGDG